MPTVMNPHHMPHHSKADRTAPQKVCIGLGVGFILIGLLGFILPGLMAMHLSPSHNVFHLVSGAIALWCGLTSFKGAFNYCVGFGALYGLLGIVGYLLGEPGFPSVGHMEADQNLFRAIPNVLEFGTMDHIVHMLISVFLLLTAYTFRKDRPHKKYFKRGL